MRLPLFSGLATFAVALSLYPLFETGEWLWTAIGAMIIVTAGMILSSRLPLPQTLSAPAGGLLALLLYLTLRFASADAYLGVLPTLDSMATLGQITAGGWHAVETYAAPVPALESILLLTTGGIGLIAVIADFLAVRLRRAALAGLPLLALFTVPAAILEEPIGWIAFVLGALAFTALLTADGRERLSRWGRPVLARRSRAGEQVSPSESLAVTGRRIGFTAVGLALIVPVAMPDLEPAAIFGFGVGGNGPGGNTITTPDPLARVQGQLTQPERRTVLTYRTNAAFPPYLRTFALDRFDGEMWRMTRLQSGPRDRVEGRTLPLPEGEVGTPSLAGTTIKVEEEVRGMSFLPIPYPAAKVSADGDWRADAATGMVWSRPDEAGGLTYGVTSYVQDPSRGRLARSGRPPKAVADRYLDLPRNLPASIRAKAKKVTKNADNPYEKAIALQKWFTDSGGFTYSLRTEEGSSSSALENFLLQTRTGYCEQFATGMAVMARMIGIPARVAIGYTSGTAEGKVRKVTTQDAHAWPELYFGDVGWLRFEPTPSGPSGQASATVPGYSVPAPNRRPGERPGESSLPGESPGGNPGEQPLPEGEAQGAQDPDTKLREIGSGGAPVDPGTPLGTKIGIAALILLMLGAVPAIGRVAVRIRRRVRSRAGPDPVIVEAGEAGEVAPRSVAVHAAWAELCDMLYDFGLPRRPSESPRALARRLTERYELAEGPAKAIARVASAEERSRYAPGGAPAPRSLGADLRAVRPALAATAGRGRRVRAVLLPPSMLRRFRAAGGAILDAFDWNPAFLRRWQRDLR